MKFFNIISLFCYLIAINIVAGAITLTPGPVTCNYKKKDLDESYDIEKDVTIKCDGQNCIANGNGIIASSGSLIITTSGTYIIKGNLLGQVMVLDKETDYIHVVFSDFTLESHLGPAFFVSEIDKLTLTLVGNNTVTDSNNYVFTEDEPDASIYVNSDLSINGSGYLTVTGNFSDAIRCRKDLKIINGYITIPSAVKKGIKARNSLCLKGGFIDVTSNDNAITVTKDTDPEKGYMVIDGGYTTITSSKKGLHAETHLTIRDGLINIKKSTEGITAQMIDILGGETYITAKDDGINASKINDPNRKGYGGGRGTDGSVYVNIVGGKSYINVTGMDVDGIDSNGVLYIGGKAEVYVSTSGGSIYGTMASLDSEGLNAICRGATVVATAGGSIRIWKRQAFAESGRIYQPYVQGSITTQSAGTRIRVINSNNKDIILSFTPKNSFSSILITSPKFKAGETYTLVLGSVSYSFKALAAQSGYVSNPPSVTSPNQELVKKITTTTTTTTTETTTTTNTTTTNLTNTTSTTTSTETNTTTNITTNTTTNTTTSTTTSTTTAKPTTTTTKTKSTTTTTKLTTTTKTKTTTTTTTINATKPTASNIPTIIRPLPTTTFSHRPTPVSSTPKLKCSAYIIEQGYKCCSDNCLVYYLDSDGNKWGYEKSEWCGCNGNANCSSAFMKMGYPCCSSNCETTYIDETGNWSIENGHWCGCNNLKEKIEKDEEVKIKEEIRKEEKSKKDEKIKEEEYNCPKEIATKNGCCSPDNCYLLYEDERGKWGRENGYWCGIPLTC